MFVNKLEWSLEQKEVKRHPQPLHSPDLKMAEPLRHFEALILKLISSSFIPRGFFLKNGPGASYVLFATEVVLNQNGTVKLSARYCCIL